MDYKITDPSEVRGFTKPEAGKHLEAAARRVPFQQAIVEIGVYFGRSLLYLARGAATGNQAQVHGVDPWDLPGERYPFAWTQEKAHRSLFTLRETREAAEWNVLACPWRNLLTLHRAFSTELAETWTGPTVGLLHVDGAHDAEHVRSDFEAWAPHLAPDAVIFWDDWVPNCQPVIDVTRALAAEGRITEPRLAKGCRRLAYTRFVK